METGLTKVNGNTAAVATRQISTLDALKAYPASDYNVLAPLSVHALSPFHAIGVDIVQLSPDPRDGHVFRVGSHKVGERWVNDLALSKVALLMFSDAAGIVWDVDECKRLDNMQSPLYVAWQAQGRIRRPDGTWIKMRASKEIDLEVVREEIKRRCEADNKKADAGKRLTAEQLEAKMHSEWMQFRMHKAARCETGAMNRVIRHLMKTKGTYTADELAKPFVIARVDLNLNSDARLREAFFTQVSQDIDDLWGGGGPPKAQLEQSKRVMAMVEPPVDEADDGAQMTIIDNSTGEIIEPFEIPEEEDTDIPIDLAATPTSEPQDEDKSKADLREKISALAKAAKVGDQLDAYCQKNYQCTYADASLDSLIALQQALMERAKART